MAAKVCCKQRYLTSMRRSAGNSISKCQSKQLG
jgi:hypothetical protein